MSTFFIILFLCTVSCYAKDKKIKTLSDSEQDIQKIQEIEYAENEALYFGNPSDAQKDVKQKTNYLLEKRQYTVSYNAEKLIPNWVAWHLCASDIGYVSRSNEFREDSDLPEQFYAVTNKDFQYSAYGFERGHMCPSNERTSSEYDNAATFIMTNMVPQSPDNNEKIWNYLENYERSLAMDGYELYIFAGPDGIGGEGDKGYREYIPVKDKRVNKKITVPASTWKIIIALPEGEDDINRINEKTLVIAVNVPNKMGMSTKGGWQQFACSIDDIEELTGYDFFELLPDDVENILEKKVYGKK